MKTRNALVFMLLVSASSLFNACEPREKKVAVTISGQVSDAKGNPLRKVSIVVNSVKLVKGEVKVKKTEFTTEKDGKFALTNVPAADKYVVNISRQGFAFVSKVYYGPMNGLTFNLTPATVITASPSQQIDATDTMERCVDPIDSASINFKDSFSKIPLVYDASGTLVGFELPDQLKPIYKTLSHEKLCASRARVIIPAGSLIDDSNNVPSGDVEINISTVNLYTPDGMPGDYTVNLGGSRGYMVSTGAVAIDAFYKGKPLKLSEKQSAKIIIPVDSSRIGESLKETIPFLVYDRNIGEWRQEGEAKLNRKGGYYEKEVKHFSEFNTDFVLSGGTCVRVDVSALGVTLPASSGYKLKIVAPIPGMPGSFDIKEMPIENPGTCTTYPSQHAILRLYENSPIGLILAQDVSGVRTYFGNYVVHTESSAMSSGEMTLPCSDYGDCYPKPNGIPILETIPTKPYLIKLPTTTPTSNHLAWAFQFADNVNNHQVKLEEAYCNNCPSGTPAFDPYAPTTCPACNTTIANEVVVDKGVIAITPAGHKVKYRLRVCENFSSGTCGAADNEWIDSDELVIN